MGSVLEGARDVFVNDVWPGDAAGLLGRDDLLQHMLAWLGLDGNIGVHSMRFRATVKTGEGLGKAIGSARWIWKPTSLQIAQKCCEAAESCERETWHRDTAGVVLSSGR